MDPLALLPYALAAGGGRVDAHDVTALVAAGVTLLQRSAPLVRALAGRRSAVLLPPGAAWIVALAASDGRGLVVLDGPESTDDSQSAWSRDALRVGMLAHDVGAVFTNRALVSVLPTDTPCVLLDEAPRRAHVCIGARAHDVDLGSHFALDLTGDPEGPGSVEECFRFGHGGNSVTHADVLQAARQAAIDLRLGPEHRTRWSAVPRELQPFVHDVAAPLLAGGAVFTAL